MRENSALRTSISIKSELTPALARELFCYEPKSGLLTWRKSPTRNKRKIGAIVGTAVSGGYRVLRYNGHQYMVHRLVWAIMHGEWPEMLDHIDGNKHNNRLENLRVCTAAQNAHNSKKSIRNTSGFKGVSWHSTAGKWVATIRANGGQHFLGLFESRESAASAYDEAATRLHGKFAKTNADLAPKSTPYLTGEIDVSPYRHRLAVRLGL